MNPQQTKIAIVVLLFAVAGGYLFYQLRAGDETLTQPTPTAGEAGAERPGFARIDFDVDTLVASIEAVGLNYELLREERDIRDPMRPLVRDGVVLPTDLGDDDYAKYEAVQQQVSTMELTGIVWNKTKPVAVVGQRVVSEGDTFQYLFKGQDERITVESIETDRVILRADDTIHTLEFKE